MYVCVHLASACFLPTSHGIAAPAGSRWRHAVAAPRNQLPHCLLGLGDRLRDELGDFVEEVQLERKATVVELPVMFIAKEELQVDEYGLLQKGEPSSTFDFERWSQHRSSSRYYRLLLGVLLGVTTRRVFPVLLALLGFSSLVCVYAQLCLDNPNLVTVQLPLVPFELTAPALALLLVFRSDNAYARFKEGSELSWEISTSIRTAMRRLLAWTAAPHVPQSERDAAGELAVGCSLLHGWIMNEHLRCGDDACPVLYDHADLLAAALGADAAGGIPGLSSPTPYHGLEALSMGAAQRLPSLTDQELIAYDESLAEVTGALGKCESFLRTPIPLGYTRYSVRFLWVWLTLLPFALTRTFCGFQTGTWWEGKVDEPWPLVCASVLFIASIFLSIEDIAVQIEEPFAILPLEFQHMWLLRDVEKTRVLTDWSLRQRGGGGGTADPERAASSTSVRGGALSRLSAKQAGASLPTEEPASAAGRLTELRELLDAGLVTEAEYEETRERIVGAL